MKELTLEDSMIEHFQDDPEVMNAFLEVTLQNFQKDRNARVLTDSLHTAIEAQGGLDKLAQHMKLKQADLEKMLSPRGRPKLDDIHAVLEGLGYRVKLEPLKAA